MRTKTILLSAAIGALSSAALMAQVYSVNTVGYINVTCVGANQTTGAGGFTIIADQLNSGNNVITNLIAVDPAGSMDGDTLYKYNPATQSYATMVVNSGNLQNNPPTAPWNGPAATTTLNPGEAAFFYNANSTITLTFVGTVLQNPSGNTNTPPFLTNSLVGANQTTGAGGFNLISSMVPQGGDLSTNLGLTVDPAGSMDGDTVYLYDPVAQKYNTYVVNSGNLQNNPPTAPWNPSSPSVSVGQGFFFYDANAPLNWVRNFVVN